MKLFSVLVLVVLLSAATGLKCYNCPNGESTCRIIECPPGTDRCATARVNDVFIKTCLASVTCTKPIECCKSDLCNGAIPTGSSILLLLLSSAIMIFVF